MDWIRLPRQRNLWLAVLNTGMNLRIPQKNFLTSWATVIFRVATMELSIAEWRGPPPIHHHLTLGSPERVDRHIHVSTTCCFPRFLCNWTEQRLTLAYGNRTVSQGTLLTATPIETWRVGPLWVFSLSTEVSEEHLVLDKNCLGCCLLSPSPGSWVSVNIFGTSVGFCRSSPRNITEDSHIHARRRDNLKPH